MSKPGNSHDVFWFIILVGLAFCFGLLWPAISHARAPAIVDPDLAPWFKAQTFKGQDGADISCCDKSDGHILDADHWRTVGDDYEVNTGDKWVKVAKDRLLVHENPTGGAVAYYWPNASWVICFIPPVMG